MDKRKIIVIIIILGLLILGCVVFVINFPSIKLKGGKNIELELNESFKEPGYSVSYLGHNMANRVKKDGVVDSSKLGTYYLKYKLKLGIFNIENIRTIKVVDRKKPEVVLNGLEEVVLCPNSTYVEEGYQAIDNYDGDLTSKVKINSSKDEIIYEVTDSSGNVENKIRKLKYVDEEPPKILLNGGDITLYKNGIYKEQGAVVTDNCDDLSNNIVISNSVDTSKTGSYQVVYKVTDSSGNQSEAIRNVKVIEKSVPKQNGDGKVIYLTFDDGPSSTITNEILKILSEENVKATFFVINHSDSLNYLIKEEQIQGHSVGIHSYSHNYSYIYSSIENYWNDFLQMSDKLYNILGVKINIFRFPGGSSNTVSRSYKMNIMTDLVADFSSKGYHYYDWNVDSSDAGTAKSSSDVYENVVTNLKYKNNVVLMHDFENNYKTLGALRDIIRYGKENGYVFKSITDETTEVHHRVNN